MRRVGSNVACQACCFRLNRPVPPLGRRALVVTELPSRKTLCLRSVVGERAASVEAVLAELIARHSAPLVLELDNGSAFLARRFASFCRQLGIALLHSPVHRCASRTGTAPARSVAVGPGFALRQPGGAAARTDR